MVTRPLFYDEMEPSLDYQLAELPGSRLEFRGPMPPLHAPFVAMLGGSETFGKYVTSPFPSLVADWTGVPVANLGVPQAGLSLFSDEPVLLEVASRADITVLQVTGAQNMSNRLYRVHARRNDRFIGVSPALRDIFPNVDFAEINFTGHLLTALQQSSPSAFSVVVDELKWAWTQRMRRLLSLIDSRVVLLWISDRGIEQTQDTLDEDEPRFVDRTMIDGLSDAILEIVEVVVDHNTSLAGMIFPRREAAMARLLPDPGAHHRIAEALAPVISRHLSTPGREPNAARRES